MKHLAVLFCITSLLAFSGVLTNTAQAGVYKCINSYGEITYTQQPCAVDERTAKVISSKNTDSSSNTLDETASNTSNDSEQTAGNDPELDCSFSKKFARKTAQQMIAGQSSFSVFTAYGGTRTMPITSLSMVNYVYTFKQNYRTTPERISDLVNSRCLSGSFGTLTCSSFPKAFTANFARCALATPLPAAATGDD